MFFWFQKLDFCIKFSSFITNCDAYLYFKEILIKAHALEYFKVK